MNVSARTAHWVKYFTAIALSLLFAQTAFTQASENQQIVVEGTLTDNSGNAIDLFGASLVFYVITNNGCYLYGESSSIAGDSQGNIIHRIGSSTLVAGSPNGFTQNLFFGAVSGTTTFAGNNCAAAAADVRLVEVYYQAQNIRATLKLGTVPYAHNATMLNGKNAADFLGVTNDSNTLFYGGSTNQVLTRAASGGLIWSTPTLTAAQVTTALGYTPASTTTSLTASSITTALGYTPANSASAGSVTNVTAGQGLSGGSITSSGTISVNFGTSAGTVAQGDDSRITGALQAANSLAEISGSAATARINLGLGSLATKSTVNLASDVSGVLPVANGGTQWSSNAAGVMTTLNATVGSSTIYSNIGLAVVAPNFVNSLIAYFNNTASDGNGVKINVDNTSSSKYGLKVSTNAATNFIVLNSGNVGVGGLANPTARLEIAAAASGVAPLRFNSGSLLTTPVSGTMEYDDLLYITDNANMRRTIATGSTNTSIDNIATINSPGNLTLTTSGVVTVNGALGIGTTSPASRLHVFSSTTEIARFDGSNTGGYLAFTRNSSPKGFIGYLSGSGTFFNNEIADAISIRSETAIQLGTGATAHLTVTSNGHVGIGTTSPTATLTVSGPIRTTAAVEFGDGSVQNSSAWGGYERISANCSTANSCMATCSAGKKIISGGCINSYAISTASALISSYPASDTQWQCQWGSTGGLTVTAWAICVKF